MTQGLLGCGATGHSVLRHLGDAVDWVCDERPEPPGIEDLRLAYPNLSFSLGAFDTDSISQAERVIVSPGISPFHPQLAPLLAAHPEKFHSDIDLFVKAIGDKPIIGVTGTNGKSTVVSLLGHIAKSLGIKVGVGGNLSPPALDLLDTDKDCYILELSSFQLAWSQPLPLAAATILNIAPDHLEWHGDPVHYHRSKERICQRCQHIVTNRDQFEPLSRLSYGTGSPETGQFGLVTLDGVSHLAYGAEALLPVDQLQLMGLHQVSNVLAALALGLAVGWPLPEMVAALPSFAGLQHRCQHIGMYHGLVWVNDSKATNVMAACAAINSLGAQQAPGKIVLLAGGQAKESDFSALAQAAKQHLRAACLFGQDADRLAEALSPVVDCHQTDTLQRAISLAQQQAEPGDLVLLAPACASFDQFDNYQQRGKVFVDVVSS